jgi:cytochrome P450
VLKDNFENYEKGKVWRSFFREILGNGIFNADGELWASHRKIAAKLFSRNLCKAKPTAEHGW